MRSLGSSGRRGCDRCRGRAGLGRAAPQRRRHLEYRPSHLRSHDNRRALGVGDQAALDHAEVHHVEAAPQPDASGGQHDGDREQLQLPHQQGGRARQEQHLYHAGAKGIACAVARDVEKGLRAPFLGRVHRDEEQLVAAAEHRGAEHRLDPAHGDEHRETREKERRHPADPQPGGQARNRPAESELPDDVRDTRLREERGDLHDRVEHGEEPQQLVGPVRELCVRLQQVVDDGSARAAEHDDEREHPDVRRGPERPQVEEPRGSIRGGSGRRDRGPPEPQDARGAQRVQPGQQEQGRVGGQCRGTRSGQSAQQAAEGAGRRDPAVAGLGRLRIEQLADERPEPRQQHRAQPGHVEIDRDRHPGTAARETPLDGMRDGAQQEPGGHDHAGTEPGEQARIERNGEHHRHGRRDHHRRQRLGRPRRPGTRRHARLSMRPGARASGRRRACPPG